MSTAEIKKILGTDKIIIGTDRALKCMKRGEAEKVFIASNCPDKIKRELEHYAGISEVELEFLEIPNEELGVLCKKPFSVSLIARIK
ncbi:ribosomal L7Ae/L30e/S12e/Gadd45 family protein [Nanoarchaeota archaeon]